MAEFEPGFVNTVGAGDMVVAGRNFGYGHPHDQGIEALRSLGCRNGTAP
jgi:3-isopropylmalate/(R)-2-methylmalate dehydratase small subunit